MVLGDNWSLIVVCRPGAFNFVFWVQTSLVGDDLGLEVLLFVCRLTSGLGMIVCP